MKLTDLPKEQINQISQHLPAANRVRLAAVSKELHSRVNGVRGPMSPHPSHDTLREPHLSLITHVAQRFTDLRDFLRVCAATGPIEVIECNDYPSYNYFPSSHEILAFEALQKRTEDRYKWFVKLWETHSKVPSRDAVLRMLVKGTPYGEKVIGCSIRVNCGPTYYFKVHILWEGANRLSLSNFYFENHDGVLELLYRVPQRLDTEFEDSFAGQFSLSWMTIYMKEYKPMAKIRDCARLAVVFRKVMILLNFGTLRSIRVDQRGYSPLDRRAPLAKILNHNGFDAVIL